MSCLICGISQNGNLWGLPWYDDALVDVSCWPILTLALFCNPVWKTLKRLGIDSWNDSCNLHFWLSCNWNWSCFFKIQRILLKVKSLSNLKEWPNPLHPEASNFELTGFSWQESMILVLERLVVLKFFKLLACVLQACQWYVILHTKLSIRGILCCKTATM